ncbi:MAG TPA: hypothetical protein VGK75_12230 [Casimicrobiaceae bacterium]|jgi:hypothetical protein
MNPRLFLIALVTPLAIAGLPALAQAPATATAMPAIPSHSCVAPKYPSEAGLQKRGEAYNRAVDAFNRDYKTYGECIKKYVEDSKVWVKAAADAGNKAIDEYNKYSEELKQKIDAEK